MQKHVYCVLIILPLVSCAARISPAQRLSYDHFIGLQARDLVAQLGPPNATRQTGEMVDLDFVSEENVILEPNGFVFSGVNVRAKPELDHRRCDITFRVKHGQVAAWKVDGDYCSSMPLPRRNMTYQNYADYIKLGSPTTIGASNDPSSSPLLEPEVVRKGQFYTQ